MSHPLPSFRSLDTCPQVPKGWGHEVHVVNFDYCGKLLCFKAGGKLSFHHHSSKAESFLISAGRIVFRYIDTSDASVHERIMENGDIVDIPRLMPHQIEALEDSVVTEFSTHDLPEDSFRVLPGNSQTAKADEAVAQELVRIFHD